jgi:hypothetical protein
MGRLSRNVGKDGEITPETSTTIVYYCEEHGTAIGNKTCQDQFEIGWVTSAGDYIAKGIPNG